MQRSLLYTLQDSYSFKREISYNTVSEFTVAGM